MSDTVDSLVAFCRENNRVCPLPTLWNDLFELLPDRKRSGPGWEPPLPLILAAWHDTPVLLKMLRLTEHIRWAVDRGALESVSGFLRGLREDQWFHIGD